MKTVDTLTNEQLASSVESLVLFYNFTFFSERDVSVSDGLCYAVEMQVCTLGLVPKNWASLVDYDSSNVMEDYVSALHTFAIENNVEGWQDFCGCLPYIRGAK